MTRFLPAIAMVILLTACASPIGQAPSGPAPIGQAPSGPTPSSTVPAASSPAPNNQKPVAVSLTRSGGLAGSTVHVIIAPDGEWNRTDRTGASVSGRLTPAQVTDLQQLARQLVVPSPAPTRNFACEDGFTYAVTAGAVTVAYSDCTSPRPSVASQIFAAVAGWNVL